MTQVRADESTGRRLSVSVPRGPVTGVALVLHGGRSRGTGPVRPWQLAVLRMVPFARALRRAGAADGLAVARLRFAVRGWNGASRSPVPDARAALDELAQRYPGVPIAVVGHSMGGRTAVHVADHAAVSTVVGLAPWLEPGDPIATLAGRRVLFAHGTRDRMTDPRATRDHARRAAGVAAAVSYVGVTDDTHAMLRRARVWTELVVGYVTGTLYDRPRDATAEGPATNVVRQALAGERLLVV